MSISINNLTKTYGTQKAVNNISFNVAKGEIVGFLGPNGAGKSTTMKMITGYLNADEGSIEVAGIKVHKDNIASKQKIGYLPEANPLYFEMYVREYLAFNAGLHKITNAKDKIEEIIKTVGLSVEAHKKIGQLSKGYKQRVGLAAAMLHDPEVLILDEPTTGLDPNQIIEIRNVIKSLAKDKTVLFSSHILQEVEAICDRVIIIHKGNIVANDTLQNLQATNKNVQTVVVHFKEKINANLISELQQTKILNNTDNNIFEIECADAEKVKKQILQLSISHNLNILSIQSQSKNLEAVFKELTNEIS
jgi:ABC-2 type transport system ATP-binding protein